MRRTRFALFDILTGVSFVFLFVSQLTLVGRARVGDSRRVCICVRAKTAMEFNEILHGE